MKIAPGVKVTACRHSGFVDCADFRGWVANVGAYFNDNISSFTVTLE